MARRAWGWMVFLLLLAVPAWAGISVEELQEQQKKLIEREMKKEEHRQEKMAEASEALRNKDFDRVIKLTSEMLSWPSLGGSAKAEVLVLRGVASFHKGDLVRAKADVDEAVRRDPKEARAYLVRSAIHEKENRREQAVSDMENYVGLRPQDQERQKRLQQLKGQPVTPTPAPRPAPGPASPAASVPALKLYVARDRSFALHKPADWLVHEDPRPDSRRITVMAPDQSAAVDFLWARNSQGQTNALLALEAYRQRLVLSGGQVQWSQVYRTNDLTRARASMKYQTAQLALEGTFYFEASNKAISAQGYLARDGQLAQMRPLLYNIISSMAFSQQPASAPVAAFRPQYVDPPLVGRRAPDGSLSMSTPQDWGFAAAKSTVITGAPNGGAGFAFLSLSGNPVLRGATVAQGVIAQTYLPPPQALQVILAGLGHRNIAIQHRQGDPTSSQELARNTGRRGDAQDMVATWTSDKGAPCQGFFKVICAAPSPTGMWFCILAGVWGPQQNFYRYYPLLEKVGSSFAINEQFARCYIQDGLKRARELHDKTMAAMRANANAREQQQADWEARQERKKFADSKWDDYRRGKTYWVSDMENGKVYQSDSHGLRDTGSNEYYPGTGFNSTNFDGRNPRHPSEIMTEVTGYEAQQIQGR